MIVGLVLAAGLSRRMGRRKLLLELDSKPILRWSVEHVVPHVDAVRVVTGPDDVHVRAVLAGLPVTFAVNSRPEDGQGTSIAAGVAGLDSTVRAVLIALGDQPRVPPAVIPALLEAFDRARAAIVAPVYQGTQGTPVLFGREVFSELSALTGDAGARAVVRRDASRVALVPFDLPMPIDIDTPEDYERLA